MNIPARLAKSRHGVYYYRIQFQEDGVRRERRISLDTKHPATAKRMAIRISAIIDSEPNQQTDIAMAFDPNDPRSFKKLTSSNLQKLDIITPDGHTLKAYTSEDVKLAREFLFQEAAKLTKIRRQTASQPANQHSPAPSPAAPALATVVDTIKAYQTRNSERLASKSMSEYLSYQNRFAAWIAEKNGTPDTPISHIDRKTIAEYIDHLIIVRKLGLTTIKQKHLAALGGLFDLAISKGDYPDETPPTRGHKIISKNDIKKRSSKSSWKQFSTDELKKIFEPTHYLKHRTKPDDFWLPFLALFTGARLNELCQLPHADIKQEHGVWLLHINDEGDKQVKSIAAVRKVPIHSKLLELGFLDYVEDTKSFGGMIFPHLTQNKFGGYSDTPSERWGKYLDDIGIADKKKVFHSFRKTANDRLKQSGVHVEARCQIVGHEFESINSQVYSEELQIKLLREHIEKLDYNEIDLSPYRYTKGMFSPFLTRAMQLKARKEAHQKVRAEREAERKK